MNWAIVGCVAGCLAAMGCSKSAPVGDDAAAAAKAGTGTGESATDGGAVSKAEGGAAKAGAVATFIGKYVVTAGTMYVPAEKDWASVKFKNDDSKMLGDGEMTVTIDPSGRVSGGTEAGPMGASVLDGTSYNGVVTGTLRRKDPSDEGLTGTLIAKLEGDVLSGTMRLADSNAAVVREAKLDAKKAALGADQKAALGADQKK